MSEENTNTGAPADAGADTAEKAKVEGGADESGSASTTSADEGGEGDQG